MKAISLWQPWASAIPLGLKRIETRHWVTSHRGPIAIHAAKRWTPKQRAMASAANMQDLPFGAIIAVANLTDIFDAEALDIIISPTERHWGVYGPRRYGWWLDDVRQLSRPFAYKGGQGIFNVPDDMIADAL